MANVRELVTVFEEARTLVVRPENDFSYSGWDNASEALNEIEPILAKLRRGELPQYGLSILFAPTGPLQELSLSSGWGDEFCQLADRFDAAMAARADCICLSEPSDKLLMVKQIGEDSHFGEVSVLRCPECAQLWVRYLIENEGFTASGRWYLGAITPAQLLNLTSDCCLSLLGQLDSYFVGGSAFDGKWYKQSGPIRP